MRGNAVLFYSMVPDGRLDERSLHGGCRPRKGPDGKAIEKWGANQWIWNHASGRNRGTYPRRGAKPRAPAGATSGCTDDHDNCEAWAADGECAKNPQFMEEACRSSCGKC